MMSNPKSPKRTALHPSTNIFVSASDHFLLGRFADGGFSGSIGSSLLGGERHELPNGLSAVGTPPVFESDCRPISSRNCQIEWLHGCAEGREVRLGRTWTPLSYRGGSMVARENPTLLSSHSYPLTNSADFYWNGGYFSGTGAEIPMSA